MELLYIIFILYLRREIALNFIFGIPITGLWIGALKLDWPSNAALILPALVLEGLAQTLMTLPIGDQLLRGSPRRTVDPEFYIERLQGFFVIILGEGLYVLVVGGNWGLGFGTRLGMGIQALLIYYALFWLFFLGDAGKTYIHALFRNQYTAAAYES